MSPRSDKTGKNKDISQQELSEADIASTQNLITVDDVTYDADTIPTEIKALLRDLIRFNQEAEELQYRLRQVQAAQQTYYETIKAQLTEKGVTPVSNSASS
jgi:hypothetical protein